jgi:hypothetical protein
MDMTLDKDHRRALGSGDAWPTITYGGEVISVPDSDVIPFKG